MHTDAKQSPLFLNGSLIRSGFSRSLYFFIYILFNIICPLNVQSKSWLHIRQTYNDKFMVKRVDGCDEMATGLQCNLDFAPRKCGSDVLQQQSETRTSSITLLCQLPKVRSTRSSHQVWGAYFLWAFVRWSIHLVHCCWASGQFERINR